VKICPNPRSPSFGLGLRVVDRLIRIGSVMVGSPQKMIGSR
jgi:hypothetical protein